MRKGLKREDIVQLVRFGVVGTTNAIIDFGVLNLFLSVWPTNNAWITLFYNSVAVLLASTNSFFFNKYWTFQQKGTITRQEITRFATIASGTTIMNDCLIWLLGRIVPSTMSSSLLTTNALKLGAILGTMSISFFGMRLWVFFQKRHVGEERLLADVPTMKLPSMPHIADFDTMIIGTIRLSDSQLAKRSNSKKI